MIIENTISKEKIEEIVKIFCKYSMLQQKQKFKKIAIVAMCFGILLILSYWFLFNGFIFFVGHF